MFLRSLYISATLSGSTVCALLLEIRISVVKFALNICAVAAFTHSVQDALMMSLSPCKSTSLHCLCKGGHVCSKSAYCAYEVQQTLWSCYLYIIYLLPLPAPPQNPQQTNTSPNPKPQNFHNSSFH